MLVLSKPALLATMGVNVDEDSLVKRAKQYLKEKYAKPGNVYLGVVSRLDSFVSGVVVLARTSKAAARLNRQFAGGLTKKNYLAIVPKGDGRKQGNLTDWISKNESRHRMQVVSKEVSDAKEARLSYRTIGEFQDLSLLEIDLHTGRKHQIRVQLSATNRPIVGDRKYGSSESFKKGIALHSFQLRIEHPTLKEKMLFESPPPAWWRLERFR